MIFKDNSHELEYEFAGAPLLLRDLVTDADTFLQENYGKELTITRVTEAIAGSSGVHEDYRGVDARFYHEGKNEFTDEEVQAMMTFINARYARNDDLLSVILHSFQGGPKHLHFQISAFTKAYMPRKAE